MLWTDNLGEQKQLILLFVILYPFSTPLWVDNSCKFCFSFCICICNCICVFVFVFVTVNVSGPPIAQSRRLYNYQRTLTFRLLTFVPLRPFFFSSTQLGISCFLRKYYLWKDWEWKTLIWDNSFPLFLDLGELFFRNDNPFLKILSPRNGDINLQLSALFTFQHQCQKCHTSNDWLTH